MPKHLLVGLLAVSTALFGQNPATKTPPLPDSKTPAKSESSSDLSKLPAVIQEFSNTYRWEADGTGTRETLLRAKVQSPLGVQQFGLIPIGYSSANESVKINYARVRKSGGTTVDVPMDGVQDLTAPIVREAPMYSDYRIKQIVVPALEVGDTLEYDITVTITKPLAEKQFWVEHDFNKKNVMLDEQLVIDVPSAVKVTLKTTPGFEPKVANQKGRVIYSWKRKNLAVEDEDSDLDSSNAKKKKWKDETDPDRRSDVQLTTFQSWTQLGDWFAALVNERAKPNDALRVRAEELTKGKTSEKEKVQALYDFVSQQYRYVSLSFGVGRFQPHPAVEIYSNHYGDCKDKYTLLASLLEASGIHSDPVLIHSWRHLDESVPSPAQFDHVISAVTIGDSPLILDATPEVAPFGLLSPTLRHKKALLVRVGATRVIDTPATLPFPPHEEVVVEGKVNDLGKLEGTMKIAARGDSELTLRSAFRQVPESRWNQVAKLFLSSIGINGEAANVQVSPVADTSVPFTMQWALTAVNYLDWTNKSIELRPPVPPTQLPAFEEQTDADHQKPLPVLGAPTDVVYRAKLTLPSRYSVTLPVPVNLVRDYGEFHTKYTRDAATNSVEIEKHFTFTKYEVPYSRRGDYLAFQRSIAADEQQRVRLLSTSAESASLPAGMKADDLNDAGVNALSHNNPREAAKLFERVVELEPKHQSAWNNLGRSYMNLGQYQKAESAFRKQADINPYDEYAFNNLGLALEQQEDYSGAIQAFKKQIEVNPLDKFAHANLGTLLIRRKRFTEAVPELETAVGVNPESAYLHVQLGTGYLNTNNREKATAEYARAIELSPIPLIWNDIAYELSEKGVELDRARSYGESAVTATAANLRNVDLDHLTTQDLFNTNSLSASWDTLGWIYFKQGDTQRALTYIIPAFQIAQHSDIADHLGTIYGKQGKADEAKHYYALAAAATNSTPDAHEHALKAFGSEKELNSAIANAKIELGNMRTFRVENPTGVRGSADFFLLFDPHGKLASAKLVRGVPDLKAFESKLSSANVSYQFPEGSNANILRRASLVCPEGQKDCILKLDRLEETNSID